MWLQRGDSHAAVLAGKAEFAAWLKARTDGLPRLTAHTVTQTKEFKALIEQVRSDDHALASQTHEL